MRQIELSKLAEPFPADQISWRIQHAEIGRDPYGVAVPYLTKTVIVNRLNKVCGPDRWYNQFTAGPAGGLLCGITVIISDDLHITKWDGADNPDEDQKAGAKSRSVKGGLSDAMKRAFFQWGCTYLTRIKSDYVKIHKDGKFTHGKKGEGFRWDPPDLPKWALPPVEVPSAPPPSDEADTGRPTPPAGPKSSGRADSVPCDERGDGWDYVLVMGEHFGSRIRDLPEEYLQRVLKYWNSTAMAAKGIEGADEEKKLIAAVDAILEGMNS